MSLLVLSFGPTAQGYDPETGECGPMLRLVNQTGHTSVKGELVSNSESYSNSIGLSASGYNNCGVVAESGIAVGELVWCWINGAIGQCLLEPDTAATLGHIAIGSESPNDGRITGVAVPTSNPAQSEHFRECGHIMENVALPAEGESALVKVWLHFN